MHFWKTHNSPKISTTYTVRRLINIVLFTRLFLRFNDVMRFHYTWQQSTEFDFNNFILIFAKIPHSPSIVKGVLPYLCLLMRGKLKKREYYNREQVYLVQQLYNGGILMLYSRKIPKVSYVRPYQSIIHMSYKWSIIRVWSEKNRSSIRVFSTFIF